MLEERVTVRPRNSKISSGHPILDELADLFSNTGDLELIVADGIDYVIFAHINGKSGYKFTKVDSGYLLTKESLDATANN